MYHTSDTRPYQCVICLVHIKNTYLVSPPSCHHLGLSGRLMVWAAIFVDCRQSNDPFSFESRLKNCIDTDDECEEDELNIGWDGGADNINGRPLTEADVDSNALPAGTSAPADDDEEDDNFEEPLFVDESGNVVRAAATVGDGDDEGGDGFYDAMEEWDADYHGDDDESPNDDDAAGDEEEDRRVEEEAIADSAGTTGQPQQKKQKTPAEVRYKTVEIPDSILASLIS